MASDQRSRPQQTAPPGILMDAVIIGCGNIAGGYDAVGKPSGTGTHVRAYQKNPQTRLVAVADVDPERARSFAKKWGVPHHYGSVKQMLAERQPRLASICVPPEHQGKILKTCLASDSIRGLWCEKPFGLTHAQSLKWAQSCKARKVSLVINYQRHDDLSHQAFAQEISSGKFGEIQQVVAYYTNGIFRNGSHWLQLFASWFGPATEISFLRSVESRTPHDPTVDAFIRFGKVPVHLLGLDGKYYSEFSLQVWGSKKFGAISRYGLKFDEKKVLPDNIFPGYFQLDEKASEKGGDFNDALRHTLARLVKLASRRSWDEVGVSTAVEAIRISEHLKKQALRKTHV